MQLDHWVCTGDMKHNIFCLWVNRSQIYDDAPQTWAICICKQEQMLQAYSDE